MEHSLLSPKVDIIFKKIFGDIKKSILISFLNSLLGIDKEILANLEIINNELLPVYYDDKIGVLDIKVKLKSNELINIEIQIANLKNMTKRIHYYISKLYDTYPHQLTKSHN